MYNIINTKANLTKLKKIAKNLAILARPNDIYLLQGDLGSGKTTFARFFIESIFKKNFLKVPSSIKSPTYPILINYLLKNFEICHYDLYRIKKNNEITEIGIFENFHNNVSLVEWPELILNSNSLKNYYLIKFNIEDLCNRKISISHTLKKKIM